MDFHHLDPATKDYNIGRLTTYSIDVMKHELDKCVLLCRNCHAETHHGLVDLTKLVDPAGIEPATSRL